MAQEHRGSSGPGGGMSSGGGGGPRGPAGAAGGPPKKGRGRRFIPRRKVCGFCVDHVEHIDYKSVGQIRRYLSDRARIEPRRKTGTCAKHQRMLATALKRARHLAMLPFTPDHIREAAEGARSAS